MKKVSLYLLSLILSASVFAQKDTAKVGLFITSLYNFDLADRSFTSDMWLWVNHKNDSLSFENGLEIANSKSAEYFNYVDEMKGGMHWVTVKCRAVVRADWDISDFPFDKQTLVVEVEEVDKDTTELVYVADVANSKIDQNVKLDDWVIAGFHVREVYKTYNTTYGDPELSDVSVYPQIRAEITLKRVHVWVIFFKIFTGLFVGFLISVFVFFIKPINVDPRFGLCVGGLFAAVGNKYVVESNISTVSANTLIDSIHNLTFVSILLVIVISILSLYIYEKGTVEGMKTARKIDRYSFITLIVGYFVATFIIVSGAMSAA